jgi:hypothetical protein
VTRCQDCGREIQPENAYWRRAGGGLARRVRVRAQPYCSGCDQGRREHTRHGALFVWRLCVIAPVLLAGSVALLVWLLYAISLD